MEIKLADGIKYDVQPLTLGSLEKLQPLIKKVYKTDSTIDVTDSSVFGDIVTICLTILKKTNPDMTEERVREIIDIKNIKEVFSAGFGAEQGK
jgi:hypothetical protein